MTKSIFAIMLLSATTAFAQVNPAAAVRARTAKSSVAGAKPAVLDSGYFEILPHLLDGGQWTSQIIVTNLGNQTEPWEVDLYNDSGSSLQLTFSGLGAQSTLTGSLAAGQTTILSTTGAGSTLVDGYGILNLSGTQTGADVVAYEILRNSIPAYQFASESSIMTSFGVGGSSEQPGAVVPFDNTNGYVDGIAFTNADITNQYPAGDVLDAIVYDQNGNQIGSHQISLGAGQKTLFVLASQWPETANAQGSIYLYPDVGTFSGICPTAFRFLILSNSQTFVTLPVLQYY